MALLFNGMQGFCDLESERPASAQHKGTTVYCGDTKRCWLWNGTQWNQLNETELPGGTSTFLRGDGTFAVPPGGGSTPTGTGWRHITGGTEDAAASTPSKSDVGLGNVDNTSDASKPVSTAQQSALDLKANLAGPALTGTPTAPTAAGTTNNTQIATTAFAQALSNNGSYRVLAVFSASHTAGKVAGTYALSYGGVAAVGGTGTLYPLGVFHIVGADFPTINGVATKLRIRAQLYTNDVAPTGNYTFGLYPITRPATSGGAGLCIFTLGTVVSGSNGATFTAPAADLLGSAVGSDFTIPADGPYVIAVVTTATVATSAHVHLHAQLQMRNA